MRTFLSHREDGAPPRRRVTLSALLALGLVATSLTALGLVTAPQAASAAPGNPGNPSDPTVLYSEGFQNTSSTPELLTNYTSTTGEQYTADDPWLTNCNGIILQYNDPDSALSNAPVNSCTTPAGGTSGGLLAYSFLRQEAWALGKLRGNEPTTNNVVSAYTQGNPGANLVEFQTVQPIPLNGATGRFVTFSVDGAAVNCASSGPLYNFYLVQSDGTQVKVGDTINMCTSGTTITAPAVGSNGSEDIHVGTYRANSAIKLTGSTVGVILRNANGSGTGNDASFDNIQILDATPQMDKSFSPTLQRVGDSSTLTFTVTNTSDLGSKQGWGFTDTLPNGLTLASSTVGGTCDAIVGAQAGGTTVRVAEGNLTVGEKSCTITVQVTAAEAGTYQNCPNTNVTTSSLNQPDCATVRFEDPQYTVSKTVNKASAYEGDVVTYSVTVTNTGSVPYSSSRPASFNDDLSKVLDDATYNNDASDGATVSGNTLSWAGPLAVGETKTITYSVTVNKPDTGDKVLTNAVTPTGPGGDCDTDPTKTCSTDTPVQSYTVEKTADQSTLSPGKKITYTVTVKNTGKVAYTNANPAAFTDDLSSVTDDATYNGDASNGATVDGNTLSWKGPLPIGATQTITYSFTVNDPDTGDKTLKNGVVPTSPGGGCAKEPCNVETPVGTYVIKKSVDKTSAKEGDTVTWTVAVQNTGKADVAASFTDDLTQVLDDATYNKDAQASAGTVSYSQPTLSWNGTVPVGQTITITYSATVNTPDTGDRDLHNVITSPSGCKESGAICETDTPVQQFRVTKVADQTSAQEGDTVKYTITVENTGKVDYTDTDPATFTDDMTKVLDDATYNNDAAASAGTVSYTAPKLNWSGPLAVGDTATVTYSVKVNTPDTGDKSLDNVVVSPGCYPNDPNCEVKVPVASYTVAKQTDKTTAKPGDVVHYTVTVTNTGQVAYTTAKPATFTDDLSKVTDDATYNGDASNGATVKGNTLSWSGALDKGQTITVTYSFTINNPDTGDQKLVNVVDPGKGTCATQGGCTTSTTVTPTPPSPTTPQGPTVATGGTAITGLGVWPMIGAAGAAIAVLLALLTMTVINRRRNGDSA